jgi:hypothetical protein
MEIAFSVAVELLSKDKKLLRKNNLARAENKLASIQKYSF